MMTREEAIELVCYGDWLNILMPHLGDDDINRLAEAMCIIGNALRPVSREQVEKVWSGCDFCNTADFGEFGFEITKHYAKICCALGSWRFPEKEQFLFCPKCGKPLTDEAVEMVMERLEALKDGKGD